MPGSIQGMFSQLTKLPSATTDSDTQVGLGILPIDIGIIYQALLIRPLLIHGSLAASFLKHMGQLRLSIIFLLTTTILRGQEIDFELTNVKFKGLEFSTPKEKITKAFGQGKKVETNYECGFFTNDQERGPYYQLVYADFGYIGSDKDKFFLQHVTFDIKGEIKINYRDTELSGWTTKDGFIKIFGDKVREYFVKYPDKDSILLYSKGSDDGAIFTFKDNKLTKFEYWTPC